MRMRKMQWKMMWCRRDTIDHASTSLSDRVAANPFDGTAPDSFVFPSKGKSISRSLIEAETRSF